MSARDIVGGLAGAAVGAVKHPVGTAGEAISKAKGVVSAGTAVGTAVAGRVLGGAGEARSKAAVTVEETADRSAETAKETADKSAETVKETADKAAETVKETADKAAETVKETADDAAETTKAAADGAAATAKKAARKAAKASPATKAPAKKSTAKKSPAKKAPAKREPQVVLAEPAPPLEPPVDVVGEALAAEQEDTTGFGRTTEPRGASRDEEHGDAALQRAESDEIAEEMAEVARAGNLDLSTPVGTTGADTGFNPDTAEAGLQQPGTEPLLDPSLTKEVKAEQDTLHQAADPEKG